LCGFLQNSLDIHQLGRLNPAVGLYRLAAIAAIFWHPPVLMLSNVHKLDFANSMMGAMNRRGLINQLVKRQVEQGGDFFAGPISSHFTHLNTPLISSSP
jgi:hypothetical protein